MRRETVAGMAGTGERHVPLFLSEHANKVDKKGRVSVPAPYRTQLAPSPPQTIYGLRSFDLGPKCIEMWPYERIERLQQSFDDNPDAADDEQRNLALYIFSESRPFTTDETGRIQLPSDFLEHAGIDGEALFVGCGSKFQVWQPEAYRAVKDDMRNGAAQPTAGATLHRMMARRS